MILEYLGPFHGQVSYIGALGSVPRASWRYQSPWGYSMDIIVIFELLGLFHGQVGDTGALGSIPWTS